MYHFVNFYERAIYQSDSFLISIEYFYSFVGHVWLVELDRSRADEFVGVEDGENEFGLLVVPFQDGVTVVALFVGRNEVGMNFLLCLSDFDSESGDILEIAGF